MRTVELCQRLTLQKADTTEGVEDWKQIAFRGKCLRLQLEVCVVVEKHCPFSCL